MLTSRDTPSTDAAAQRARAAASAVNALFGRRLFGLPGTRLARTRISGNSRLRVSRLTESWHYWWQAHYLDCLVDAALREAIHDDGGRRVHRGRQLCDARDLLRGIWLRNGMRWRNSYYDDMAWLALAVDRLAGLTPSFTAGRAAMALRPALVSAHTPELGGGLFWNTARDFKNTPATAPAALYFARRGQTRRAQELLDWLQATLWDAESGLYLDGVRIATHGPKLEPAIYSYNQGTVLGALLAVGGAGNMARAEDLIRAVQRRLADERGALRTHGKGDGGLFTGILCRYLAEAALSPGLSASARDTASTLITTTADALWVTRSEATRLIGPLVTGSGGRRRLVESAPPAESVASPVVFSATPGVAHPAGTPVELSTQLQAWTAFEAEHRVAAGIRAGRPTDGRV